RGERRVGRHPEAERREQRAEVGARDVVLAEVLTVDAAGEAAGEVAARAVVPEGEARLGERAAVVRQVRQAEPGLQAPRRSELDAVLHEEVVAGSAVILRHTPP